MDSTLTLVNPSPPTQYTFSTNNIKNAVIFARPFPSPGQAQRAQNVYTVSTELKSDKRTELTDTASGRLVAVWERRDILPDTVTFPDRDNGSTTSVSKWLSKGKLPDGMPVHVMQTAYGPLVWKSDATYRLGLFIENNLLQPVAYYQLDLHANANANLVIDANAEQIRTDIIFSFIILEQRLRVSDRNINVGGGKFEMNRTVLGHHVMK
ncbi:hypothetical protein BJ138DRAFT_1165041 [Hygrophoropsis aurantiaca]|uniref:Uncharacterized protein n=1 Tax=Hygrophoropsis aurantiaca TaxID=72124 RepID=A0ACB7ZWZ3_9AGAM|nr:hypothetical protein BJ138DRAFT_1165041 [Hygrophoropsis aurantiaca]